MSTTRNVALLLPAVALTLVLTRCSAEDAAPRQPMAGPDAGDAGRDGTVGIGTEDAASDADSDVVDAADSASEASPDGAPDAPSDGAPFDAGPPLPGTLESPIFAGDAGNDFMSYAFPFDSDGGTNAVWSSTRMGASNSQLFAAHLEPNAATFLPPAQPQGTS